MVAQLAKHGTQAGYKAEKATGSACKRCTAAHRVYNSQYTAAGKSLGLRYTAHQVLDHLASPPGPRPPQGRAGLPMSSVAPAPEFPGDSPPEPASAPTLGQRLGSLLSQVRVPDAPDDAQGDGYVPRDEPHDYIRAVDPDPSPDGDEQWQPDDGDFVVNAAGMKKIEDNIGFYFTTVGMTLELIDPYCGSVAAANANNIVGHWAKVVSHYPSAANFFMSEKSGKLFEWINAIQATWPLLYAAYEHHLAHTIIVKDGVILRQRKGADGQPVPDPTMPPMPGDNYQYTAR